MDKNKKNDFINISILIIYFFIIFLVITRFHYMYGSHKDWNSQHWVFAEYYRSLFYQNHDLFPDFFLNLGNGQNIYNFSYYGFLNPIILLSYFLPFIAMKDYLVISTILLLLISVVMMYYFIKEKTNRNIAFVCSFIFLMATPIIFHSHRHIMFINYFPFLIMGYFGVEKYFKSKKRWLLTMAVFLMIMTSYFFSVCGIVSITIYGIYYYLKENEKITFKQFVRDGIAFAFPIIIGVLLSCILIVPTFYSLLNGRQVTNSINILKLLLPNLNAEKLFYSPYSLGLSSLALLSLIGNFFTKKKENIFLTSVLSIILVFPIFSYLLNGSLYVESKILIPLIPLFILSISIILKEILLENINIKLISMMTIFVCCLTVIFKEYKLIIVLIIELLSVLLCINYLSEKKTFKYFYLTLFPVLFIINLSMNLGDHLIVKNKIDIYEKPVLKLIEEDDSFYRINILDEDLDYVNRIYNSKHYSSSLYSSIASINYEDFFYNRIGNEISFRTYRQMVNTNNLFYNIYNGNKYVLSKKYDSSFYEKIDDLIYKNENVLPIGYATNRLMSEDYYNNLNYPENIYAYLKYTIVDNKNINNSYQQVFNEIDLDYDILKSDVKITKNDEVFKIISLKNKSKLNLSLKNNLRNKILLISFDMKNQQSCEIGDTYIYINGVKNTLSCSEWKYNNKNYNFKYVLSNNDLSKLNIKFSEGNFSISNLKFYTIDYSDVDDIMEDIDPFIIDNEKTKGDVITGNIDVTKDGYFHLSIPYDKGFKIFVDEKQIEYDRIDLNFIGFKISSGHHDIRIEYESPWKNVGIILSIIGIVLFLLEVYYDWIDKFDRRFSKRNERSSD